MAIVPLFGSSTLGKSSNVTAQRRVNLYVEHFGDADKTPVAIYSRPGLVRVLRDVTVAAGRPLLGPVRGMVGFYVAGSGDYVFEAHEGGFLMASALGSARVLSGTYANPGGRVSMAWNGLIGMAVDGTHGYWLEAPSGTVTGSNDTAWLYDGATSICFVAGRFVVNVPSVAGRFAWSPLNTVAGEAWDALDFATAESNPDPLVAVAECRGELLLFGTQTLEFWAPTASTDTFLRVGGSGVGWGLASAASLTKWNDGMCFLGRNSLGNRQVCMLTGYQVQAVSTPDIDYIINADPMPDTATGMAFTVAGHSFYVLNLTTTSLCFDMTTGVWSDWQTDGGRWAGQYGTTAFGRFLLSDYRNGVLYYMDENTYTDGTSAIVRELTSRHAFADLDRMKIDQLVLDCEAGTGLNTGQGSDPQLTPQISKDGGHTFGSEMWTTLGPQGQYSRRAVWNRLGIARDWVFRWRLSDPVKWVIANAAMRVGR